MPVQAGNAGRQKHLPIHAHADIASKLVGQAHIGRLPHLTIAAASIWIAVDLRRPQLYPHIDTVIADLENSTGDADFDHTLNKVLQIDLQQSPYFSVVSTGRVHNTLKLMISPGRLTNKSRTRSGRMCRQKASAGALV